MLQNVSGIVQDVFSVRQQGGFFEGKEYKLTLRRIQKPQIHQHRVPGENQNIP